MIYTPKIQKALRFATRTHEIYQKQKRKCKDIAYISHPLTAGIILSLAKASENVIIAGILHDTIEDSSKSKKVTPEMIEERFGKKVCDLVVSVTEMNKNLPWAERKALALERIRTFSHDAVLVKSADVLSNGMELVYDYGKEKEKIFNCFNAPASAVLANHARVVDALIKRWPKSPLVSDLRKLALEIKRIKKDFPKEDEGQGMINRFNKLADALLSMHKKIIK